MSSVYFAPKHQRKLKNAKRPFSV